MGRLGALLRPTWQSYAGLPPEEGAFCRLAAAALPLAAKTKQPGFARWKCTPIGAALRLGFKGFRRFKRFRGCGIALRAMSFRIPLREMENQTTELRPMEMHPYPRLRRYFPTGKHVTGFSGRYASLRIQFLCHPRGGKSALCSAFGLIQFEQHFGD